MSYQKGFSSSLLLIGIFILLFFGAIYYFWFNNNKQPLSSNTYKQNVNSTPTSLSSSSPLNSSISPSPYPTPFISNDQNAGWKVFQDLFFHFSFKYPSTWKVNYEEPSILTTDSSNKNYYTGGLDIIDNANHKLHLTINFQGDWRYKTRETITTDSGLKVDKETGEEGYSPLIYSLEISPNTFYFTSTSATNNFDQVIKTFSKY